MPINLLSKLREELYKMSEIDDMNCIIPNTNDNTKIILDFLTIAKDFRNKSDSEIIEYFLPVLKCNKIIALKSIFYLRDKVNGLGERNAFKIIINYLALNEDDLLLNSLPLIYKYGRWDDYYALFYTPLEKDVIKIFKNQIEVDLNSNKPSMLSKWLKSENTSSKSSRKLAVRTRKLLGYTSQEYRLILSSLRKKIDIIERKISAKDFRSIDYNTINFSSCLKYKKTLLINDKHRYINHIKNYSQSNKSILSLNNINQDPLNIIDLVIRSNKFSDYYHKELYDNIWSIICNTYKCICEDTYVIISISEKGINSCNKAYKVAITTILFYNNFNSNIYKDYYMYFNPKPRFGKIDNYGLHRNVNSLINIKLSTLNNIESGLDLLLFTSIKKELTNEEIPRNILIISDLDLERKYNGSTNIQLIKNKWNLSGYVMPKLKFWQIQDGVGIKGICKDIYSNTFIKGYSKDLFISLLKEEEINNDDLLLKNLDSYI